MVFSLQPARFSIKSLSLLKVSDSSYLCLARYIEPWPQAYSKETECLMVIKIN